MDLVRIEPRISGYQTSGKPLHHLVMFDGDNSIISSNMVHTPLKVGISQIGPKSEFYKSTFFRIEAHVKINCEGSCESSFLTEL
jgi:hypothetical protein